MYNVAMNIIFEFLQAMVNFIFSAVPAILGAIFQIDDSVSSIKDVTLATVLGVPVWVVTLIGGIITVVSIILLIVRKFNKRFN